MSRYPDQRERTNGNEKRDAAPGSLRTATDDERQPAPASETDATLPPVTGHESTSHIPGYQLLQELGRGGMGVVYRAHQLSLNRPVALKMILAGRHASPLERSRFRSEAEAIARLDHPSIVAIHEIGEADGVPYFSLELLEGGSLADRLDGTPQAALVSANLVERLARAIHAAHLQGIVHRDLKPANILLASDDFSSPKITDFGLAKWLEGDRQTQSGAVLGTPSYMAPEQAAGRGDDIGPRTDVYALGAILYELIVGHPPFRGETPMDTILQVLTADPVPPRQLRTRVPRDLETVCLKCLRKEPGKRYSTALELAEDLRRFQAGEPIQARPVGLAERGWRWCRRNPALAAALTFGAVAVAAVVALIVGALFIQEQSQAADRLREEQEQTREALVEAEKQRGLAEEQQKEAERQRGLAAGFRWQAERLASDILMDRGMTHCEQGYVGQGMLLFARGLNRLPETEAELRRTIRVRLSAWSHYLHPLCHRWECAKMTCRPTFSKDQRLMLTGQEDQVARLWELTTGKQVGVPLPQPSGIAAVALSPDGTSAFVCCHDRSARLWDVVTGKPIGEPFEAQAVVLHAMFSKDGKTILTANREYKVRLWESAGGKPSGPFIQLKSSLGHLHEPRLLITLGPDGRRILTSTGNTAELWDGVTGLQVGDSLPHKEALTAFTFSPDGRMVLTGSRDQTAQVWDVATGKPVGLALQHQGMLFSVCFRPDGRAVATASADHRAQLWEVGTGKPLTPSLQHRAGVTNITFSADGKLVLTSSMDHTARLWDAETGEPIGSPLEHGESILFAAIDAEKQRVVTRTLDNRLHTWEVTSGKPPSVLLPHQGGVFVVAFSPDGRYLATGSGNNKAQIWDVRTGKPHGPPMDHNAAVRVLAFSPDSEQLATAGLDGYVRLWRVSTGQMVLPPLEHKGRNGCLAYSPDGKWVMSGSEQGTVAIWDTATGKQPCGLLRNEGISTCVAFSPDGRLAATTGGNALKLWDARTWKPIGLPMRHRGFITTMAFSPDGRTVMTGGNDTTARMWDTATGEPVHEPFLHPASVSVFFNNPPSVFSVAYSPDGKTVWSGGAFGIVAWDTKTGKRLRPPLKTDYGVRHMTISPDGRLLLAGTFQGPFSLWETATGKPLGFPLPHWSKATVTHGNRVTAISPDGRLALTASVDSTARLWTLPMPLEGDPERLALWTQVVTGLEMDENGAQRAMEPSAWQQAHERLEKLGGEPVRE